MFVLGKVKALCSLVALSALRSNKLPGLKMLVLLQ